MIVQSVSRNTLHNLHSSDSCFRGCLTPQKSPAELGYYGGVVLNWWWTSFTSLSNRVMHMVHVSFVGCYCGVPFVAAPIPNTPSENPGSSAIKRLASLDGIFRSTALRRRTIGQRADIGVVSNVEVRKPVFHLKLPQGVIALPLWTIRTPAIRAAH